MNRGGWALLLGASLLAGCGLKGSLTLPEKPGDVEIRPAPGVPATSEPAAEPSATEPAPTPKPAPEEPPTGTSRE
jgi:predicted small lipoprotein YifL